MSRSFRKPPASRSTREILKPHEKSRRNRGENRIKQLRRRYKMFLQPYSRSKADCRSRCFCTFNVKVMHGAKYIYHTLTNSCSSGVLNTLIGQLFYQRLSPVYGLHCWTVDGSDVRSRRVLLTNFADFLEIFVTQLKVVEIALKSVSSSLESDSPQSSSECHSSESHRTLASQPKRSRPAPVPC